MPLLRIGLLTLLLLSLCVSYSVAQNGPPEEPTVSFAVKAMQGAQFVRTTDTNQPSDDAEFGFQRVRYNLEVTARPHERIRGFLDLGHEPNDFGTGGNSFAPSVDFVALDLLLTDALTLRFGTPVTGLFNFRGYSDGAATQDNPLIGNSPIDFVTAETGIALLGAVGNAGFDLTVTSPTFFETFAPGTGLSIVARGRLAVNDQVQLGIGVAQGTNGASVDRTATSGEEGLGFERNNWIVGDGENYTLVGSAFGQPNRYTHAYLLPGAQPTLLQVDARITLPRAVMDAWGGYGREKYSFADITGTATLPRLGLGLVETSSQMWWLGATAQVYLTDRFYVGARGSYANNSSDWASGDTGLFRLQTGVGVDFFDVGTWKLEFVTQQEGDGSPGQVGADWYGVSTELVVGVSRFRGLLGRR